MIDAYGETSRFYLEQLNAVDLVIEERTLFFQLFFNQLVADSDVVQMRHLRTTPPCYVNIAPTLRLVRFDPHCYTLEGVYQEVLGKNYDEKQLEFALRLFVLNHPQAQLGDDYVKWSAGLTSELAVTDVVPSDLLTRFMFELKVVSD